MSTNEVERPKPKGLDDIPSLTMTGVAKYMASDSAEDREKMLYDYKFPDPEGRARGDYYNWAKGAIRAYHESGNDRAVLDAKMREMEQKMHEGSPQARAKVENNHRVLTSYRSFFGEQAYVPLEHNPVRVLVEGVEIRLRPHLLAMEGKRTRVIQYAYGRDGASKEELQFSKQLLLFYATKAEMEVKASDCILLEIATGQTHIASAVGKKFEAKLKAALREIRRAWLDFGSV